MVSGKATNTIDKYIHFFIFVSILIKLYKFTVQKYCYFQCKDTEKP